jgi:hypothetical protein
MNERLQSALHQLRLSGLAQSLDVRLQEAAGHQLNHLEFLELILQDELLVRQQRQIDRRVKAADFRELKPLDEFDFAFNPSIPRAQVFELATWSDRRAPASRSSPKPSATRRSSRVTSSGIVPSSMSYATSNKTNCWPRRSATAASISSRTS